MANALASSLGKKYIMAITGILLIGFIVAHLLGNLQVFEGPEAINSYGQALRNLGPLLWVARIGLVVIFVAHIISAARLSIENKKARPDKYMNPSTIKATLTSRSMMISGLLILSYLIYHLLHFTLHVTNPAYANFIDAQGRHDVYRMVITGFSKPSIAMAYIASMVLLGAHLHHGASSFFQSLGLNNSKYRCFTKLVGPVLGTVIAIGYIIIPVAVWLKWIT